MARFQCRSCGFDGTGQWYGELVCPCCGNAEQVRAAYSLEEMTDEQAANLLAGIEQEIERLDRIEHEGSACPN